MFDLFLPIIADASFLDGLSCMDQITYVTSVFYFNNRQEVVSFRKDKLSRGFKQENDSIKERKRNSRRQLQECNVIRQCILNQSELKKEELYLTCLNLGQWRLEG